MDSYSELDGFTFELTAGMPKDLLDVQLMQSLFQRPCVQFLMAIQMFDLWRFTTVPGP